MYAHCRSQPATWITLNSLQKGNRLWFSVFGSKKHDNMVKYQHYVKKGRNGLRKNRLTTAILQVGSRPMAELGVSSYHKWVVCSCVQRKLTSHVWTASVWAVALVLPHYALSQNAVSSPLSSACHVLTIQVQSRSCLPRSDIDSSDLDCPSMPTGLARPRHVWAHHCSSQLGI